MEFREELLREERGVREGEEKKDADGGREEKHDNAMGREDSEEKHEEGAGGQEEKYDGARRTEREVAAPRKIDLAARAYGLEDINLRALNAELLSVGSPRVQYDPARRLQRNSNIRVVPPRRCSRKGMQQCWAGLKQNCADAAAPCLVNLIIYMFLAVFVTFLLFAVRTAGLPALYVFFAAFLVCFVSPIAVVWFLGHGRGGLRPGEGRVPRGPAPGPGPGPVDGAGAGQVDVNIPVAG